MIIKRQNDDVQNNDDKKSEVNENVCTFGVTFNFHSLFKMDYFAKNCYWNAEKDGNERNLHFCVRMNVLEFKKQVKVHLIGQQK